MNALTLNALQHPLDAEVRIPGSKSYTIRALLLAALTPGSVRLLNPLFSDDTLAMLSCLTALGIHTESSMTVGPTDSNGNTQPAANPNANEQDGWIDVHGHIGDVQAREVQLDANLSAASLRFLVALSAILPGSQVLYGKEGLNHRPVRDLVDALRRLGCTIEYLERDGYPPVRVSSSTIHQQTVSISGAMSSQYISALMMIAPLCDGLTIQVEGELVSRPYLDMTISTMRDFGVSVETPNESTFHIPAGQAYNTTTYTIEGDASSASYFMALAAIGRSRVTLRNLPPHSAQADMKFLEILEHMGTQVKRCPDRIVLTGHGVTPLTVNMQDCPDQAQTLAVLAAFAPGRTRIDGLRSLRLKETDRLAAVARELSKMGLRITEEAEALVIEGGTPLPTAIDTYGDHRMAMAFALAGVQTDGLIIRDPGVVSKTYPHFWEDWQRVGLSVQPTETSSIPKIVLIGFMGAGKSLIASHLARALHRPVVDMDQRIVERAQQASVRDVFEQDGELRFRELELETARSLRNVQRAVVATGGGVVMNKLAIDYLSEDGTIVFLETRLETVLTRLQADTERPLLQQREQTEALYRLRAPLYKQYASLHIQTDGKTPEAIVEEIIHALHPNASSMCMKQTDAPAENASMRSDATLSHTVSSLFV